jgi:hypothetical protein
MALTLRALRYESPLAPSGASFAQQWVSGLSILKTTMGAFLTPSATTPATGSFSGLQSPLKHVLAGILDACNGHPSPTGWQWLIFGIGHSSSFLGWRLSQ